MANLLVIEDEPLLAKNIARYFRQQRHSVEVAADGPTGLEIARRFRPDVAIVDYQLPGLNGLDVIRELHREHSRLRTLMVSGHADVSVAVDVMKAGSLDLLTKPVPLNTLRVAVERALLHLAERESSVAFAPPDELDPSSLEAILGDSAPMNTMRTLIRTLVASEPTDASPVPPILFCGETGSGKGLAARACHFSGPRAKGPFVEVGCGALPALMMEEALFGQERPGDHGPAAVGLIESADGGTLFLDDIDELDLGLQAKLLRVLETARLRRLGSLQDRPVNVRFVATTHRDLDGLARNGQFRADLLYRLRVFSVRVPPLRARGDDLLQLARYFASLFARRYNKPPMQLDASAEAALMQHSWPGNVRELSHVIERAVLLNEDGRITSNGLGLTQFAAPPAFRDTLSDLPDTGQQDELERSHLVRALEETRWDLAATAAQLGLDLPTLQLRMDRHGLYAPSHSSR